MFVPVSAAIGFFVVFEIIVRISMVDSMNFDLEMWKYATKLKQVSADAEIAHEHVPDAAAFLMGAEVTINAKKLRDRAFPYRRPEGTIRILMLGDSLTFGWGVRLEDTTSKILERSLNDNPGRARYEVINAGVGNYNTSMEVAYFLADGHRYEPSAVVLNYFINDAEETPRRTAGFLAEHLQSYVFLAGRLRLLMGRFSGGAAWLAYYRGLYAPGAAGWVKAKESIGRLAAYCADNGIPLLIANYPELHETIDYPFTDVTKRLELLSNSHRVPFVDLLAAVRDRDPETLWVSREDPHPNAAANALFAAALKTALEKMLALTRG